MDASSGCRFSAAPTTNTSADDFVVGTTGLALGDRGAEIPADVPRAVALGRYHARLGGLARVVAAFARVAADA